MAQPSSLKIVFRTKKPPRRPSPWRRRGLSWKPEVSMQECREPGTVVLSWMQAHRRGGKLLNPSQAGFHLIKRERWPIPFTPGENS